MANKISHLPSTRQIQYFAALAEHQHFGKAAASCYVSQSAFSVGIRELETLLGTQLVDRTNRKVTITPSGRDVAVQARLCLQDLAALVETARATSRPLEGPLHLGVIPTIAPFLLPRALPAIRRTHPKLKLFLYEDLTQHLYADLMDGRIDLALLALPYDLPGATTLDLFRDPFRLAVRDGTEIVDPRKYRFNALPDGSVLLLKDGHCLREHAVEACRIRNTVKMNRFSATSLLTLIEMVDADLGVTFLPEMAEGSALLAKTKVRTYPLKHDNYRQIALAWRRGTARATEFESLGQLFSDHRD